MRRAGMTRIPVFIDTAYASRVDDIDVPRMLGAVDTIRASVARAATGAPRH
jgi:hypothetical protein